MIIKKITTYIGITLLLIALSFAAYMVGLIVIIDQSIRSDDKLAMEMVDLGIKEIKIMERVYGSVKHPIFVGKELEKLDYYIDFEQSGDNSYTLGVPLKGGSIFSDPFYCVNNKYEAGIFDNSVCEL